MRSYDGSLPYIIRCIGRDLVKKAQKVEVPTWHAQDVRGVEQLVSYELQNVSFGFQMPQTMEDAQGLCNPQLPWAEDHFQERVGGEPLNPPPSAERWQTARIADKHRRNFGGEETQYSHTYPERFWPRFANVEGKTPEGRKIFVPHVGVRFAYGDLGDVVDLLKREPLTRQAYLPVWFPEDTGARHRERVPCTLGYHFMIRHDEVDITYMIRSVDFVRHFADDIYLAIRLAQWMKNQLDERYAVGIMTMHIMSLHYFQGDIARLEKIYGEN